MIEYVIQLNNGNEYLGVEEKTITVNESLKTVDSRDLAMEINHENPLIPAQVADAVLQNFVKAAAHLMSMGFAIQFKNGEDVAMRIYPDLHIKGGNINLQRAQELDPTITELTLENAGDLVSKAGVTVRAKAECEQKFTELLQSMSTGIQRKNVVEKAKVTRTEGSNSSTNNTQNSSNTGSTTPSGNEGGNTGGNNGGNTGGVGQN